MASSTNPSDKFAFLLSGTINARFERDLKNVFETLTQYYGFPASHIWISHGGSLTTPGNFTGAHLKLITADTDLSAQIAAFCTAISDLDAAYPTSAEKNTGLIYITGDSLNGSGDYKITNGGLTVTPDWLATGNFDQADASKCELIIILQNSYSQNLKDNLVGMPQDGCAISSNLSSDENHTNSTGSYFTGGWTDGLKLVPLPAAATHGNYFADMLGTAPEDSDYLVSMSESCQYAMETLALISRPAPVYEWFNNSKSYFLGAPAFLIQDGDNSTVGWWESPDITLTHPEIPGKEDDLYMPDPTSNTTGPWRNTVKVVFRNIGTHPVRKYSIGIQIYRTPLGTSSPTEKREGMDTGTVLNPTQLISYNVFSNGNKQVVTWNTPFYTGITHECIRAKAQLPVTAITFSWNVLVNSEEAQRNTDLSTDPPRKGTVLQSGDLLRGIKRHPYSITNPFNETHKFLITLVPEYQKSLEAVDIKWFIRMSSRKWELKIPEAIEPGFKSIPLILKGGQTAEILCEFGLKKEVKNKMLRLPVEILIDRNEGIKTRKPLAKTLQGKYSAIAGLTIILKNEPSDLFCKVADEKGNSVSDAFVEIQTTNGMISETFKTDSRGEIILKSINPDFYKIYSHSGDAKSEVTSFELPGHKTVKLKLVLVTRWKKLPKEKMKPGKKTNRTK